MLILKTNLQMARFYRLEHQWQWIIYWVRADKDMSIMHTVQDYEIEWDLDSLISLEFI